MTRLFILFFFLGSALTFANVRLPALFSDGMVLQQKQPVPVWGWGKPGDSVRVECKGQIKKTTVGKEGKWMLRLDPLQASSKPVVLKITVGTETKTIKNVLVGEVWICAGQSNMDHLLGWFVRTKLRTKKNKPIVEYLKKEIKQAHDPLLRQITVPHAVSRTKELTDFEGAWFESNPKMNGQFSATAYFFGRELRRELKVPIGLIHCPWGGTPVESWIPISAYMKSPDLKKFYEKEVARLTPLLAKKATTKKEKLFKIINEKKIPGTLYNGMIAPIIPYAIRGAIWYQGETNARFFPDEYAHRFSTMVKSWRAAWGEGNFPFYYAQLANYKRAHKNPLQKKVGWITICNQQRLALKQIPNSGMIVLNDVGEANDIHPKNKIDVGKRFARWALAREYKKKIVPSGPLFRSCKRKGSKMIVYFDYAPNGLIVGKKEGLKPTVAVKKPLFGFQLCGKDGVWKWADAKIISTDSVEVFSKDVPYPVAVRYAWDNNSAGSNLYNKEGLPTAIFTSEK